MKVLNLVNVETSDIEFEVSSFPDGQQDLVIKTKIGSILKKDGGILFSTTPIQIKSRFNSFRDLELIICANNALRNMGMKEIHLYIPYILGARSDRKFVEGGTSYLRDVIAPIINAQQFNSVTAFDVHSDVAEATINRLVKVSNTNLLAFALGKIYPMSGWRRLFNRKYSVKDNYLLISPDGGALKKVYKVAESVAYNGEIITCSKHRDETGNLSRVSVPFNMTHAKKDFIIVDDICDGGATFIAIAKEIKSTFPGAHIYLVVTHGIFSKGLDILNEYFDCVYTTNSVRDIANNSKIMQTKVF